jgi:hypothetical protein
MAGVLARARRRMAAGRHKARRAFGAPAGDRQISANLYLAEFNEINRLQPKKLGNPILSGPPSRRAASTWRARSAQEGRPIWRRISLYRRRGRRPPTPASPRFACICRAARDPQQRVDRAQFARRDSFARQAQRKLQPVDLQHSVFPRRIDGPARQRLDDDPANALARQFLRAGDPLVARALLQPHKNPSPTGFSVAGAAAGVWRGRHGRWARRAPGQREGSPNNKADLEFQKEIVERSQAKPAIGVSRRNA